VGEGVLASPNAFTKIRLWIVLFQHKWIPIFSRSYCTHHGKLLAWWCRLSACLPLCLYATLWNVVLRVGDGLNVLPSCKTLPFHFFRHFCCTMCRLTL